MMKKIKDLSRLEAENICKERTEKIGELCGKCIGCHLSAKGGYCYKYYIISKEDEIFCPKEVEKKFKEIEENEVEI